MDTITTIKGETGRDARRRIRAGAFRQPTSGMAPGYVQGNLAILPKALAADFTRFCILNPKPCPLLGQSEPGDWRLPMLGEDLDIRTDIPLYRVWKKGELVEEVTDLKKVWRDDLVSFVLGCSFSFEEALIENGLELRHQTCNSNVPMFRTNIECAPAGPFHGPMVVSMRPFKPADAIHIGKPDMIGIKDISKPDYGDGVPVHDDELPVFWACGVTPQSVVATVKPEFCITHAPGYMLVTDLLNSRLAVL
jgi:uncharacterized protein YcsI (UPF0317 family)